MNPSQTDIDQLLQELRETRRTLSQLAYLIRKWQRPEVVPELDRSVTDAVTGMTQLSTAQLRVLFPGYSLHVIAASLKRQGWERRRTSTARFWVAPVTVPASATVAT